MTLIYAQIDPLTGIETETETCAYAYPLYHNPFFCQSHDFCDDHRHLYPLSFPFSHHDPCVDLYDGGPCHDPFPSHHHHDPGPGPSQPSLNPNQSNHGFFFHLHCNVRLQALLLRRHLLLPLPPPLQRRRSVEAQPRRQGLRHGQGVALQQRRHRN